MQVLYTNEYMATHSLTGAKSSTSRDKVVKPAMNQNEVQEIIGDNFIALYFHKTGFLIIIKMVIESRHDGASLSFQHLRGGGGRTRNSISFWLHSKVNSQPRLHETYFQRKERKKEKVSITEKFKLIKFKASENSNVTILKFQLQFVSSSLS